MILSTLPLWTDKPFRQSSFLDFKNVTVFDSSIGIFWEIGFIFVFTSSFNLNFHCYDSIYLHYECVLLNRKAFVVYAMFVSHLKNLQNVAYLIINIGPKEAPYTNYGPMCLAYQIPDFFWVLWL